jgi:hypothetical protein
MLKRTVFVAALVVCAAAPLRAQAQGGAQSNEMTLTGTVVDLNCYVAHGASGASHKSCAEACAKAGVQLGILGADGTLYLPVSSKAGDPTNPRLLTHAEGKVKVTGTHRLSNGLHTIEIKTVEAAM